MSWVVAVWMPTAPAIVPWSSSIRATRPAIRSIASTAATVRREFSSILRPISSAASADSLASSLTSPATTAKPLPASPALAASIVALSARRFVWWAIAVIVLTTLAISAEPSPSWATVAALSLEARAASWANPAAAEAWREI